MEQDQFILEKIRFSKSYYKSNEVFNDKNTNAIVIATRHDSHGKYVLEGSKW